MIQKVKSWMRRVEFDVDVPQAWLLLALLLAPFTIDLVTGWPAVKRLFVGMLHG